MIHKTATKPRREPRQRQRIVQRRLTRAREILDAAMTIVDTQGIEALTMQSLGARLDLVPAALYRYFPSKDAVIAGLEKDAITALENAIVARLARTEKRVAEAAERLPDK